MSSGTYTFLDIPTKEPRVCWSMNTWRTRLLLNYKGLDYKTEWVEYPDIEPRLKPHVPPNEPSQGRRYQLPAIQLPDGSYVMDSYKIAGVIDEKHPEPKLPLNTPVQLRFTPLLIEFQTQLRPMFVPRVAQRLLGQGSIAYFHATREEDVGMSLEEYGKTHGPGAFDRAEPFARQITALLNETPSGPFFMGDTISYTDLMWAGILLFYKRLGEEEYEEVLKRTGDAEAHIRFLDAMSPWTKRED